MANVIAPKRTSTPGKVPTVSDLADGEICVNFADRIIYQRVGSTIRAISEPAEIKHVSVDNQIDWLNAFFYPVGTSRVLTLEPNMVGASQVFAGPVSVGGVSAGEPSFRTLTRADMAFPRDYISGFSIRTTNTQIIISSGGAMVNGGMTDVYVEAPSSQTISLSRAANTKYYLYLLPDGTIERALQIPSTAYFGSARASTNLGARRFLGMVVTDASGNYLNQWSDFGNNQVTVQYVLNTNAVTQMVSAGTSTMPADVSMAQWLFGPVVTQVIIRAYHNGPSGTVRLYTWTGSAFVIFTNIAVGGSAYVLPIMPDDTPKIRYDAQGSGSVSLTLMGYMYAR